VPGGLDPPRQGRVGSGVRVHGQPVQGGLARHGLAQPGLAQFLHHSLVPAARGINHDLTIVPPFLESIGSI